MSEKDRLTALSIVDAIEKIEKYTASIKDSDDLYANELVFDAVLMNFVVIGEMVSKLSEEFRTMHASIEWVKMKAFRNFIAHNYLGVDAEEICQIVRNRIKPLKLFLHNTLGI